MMRCLSFTYEINFVMQRQNVPLKINFVMQFIVVGLLVFPGQSVLCAQCALAATQSGLKLQGVLGEASFSSLVKC